MLIDHSYRLRYPIVRKFTHLIFHLLPPPSLNPVSLVNMVMNVGIAVEFSSHLVQAYSLAADDFPDRLERAR